MDERELPSDSDASDEDFVPEGVDSDPPSEEDSDPNDAELDQCADSEDDESQLKSKGSRKRSLKKKTGGQKKRTKKTVLLKPEEIQELEEESKQKEKLTEEGEKKRADSLWADFMKDVGGPRSTKPAVSTASKVVSTGENECVSKVLPTKLTTGSTTQKENKVTITKLFEFAGEEVRVTKEVSADSAEARLLKSSSGSEGQTSTGERPPLGRGRGGLTGISSVLSQIGKKSKISTLEKSKLDWDSYKQEQGIEEEIQTHNRGKEGYLEKQDFLQRTDLRQFEIEKQMRASRRSNR